MDSGVARRPISDMEAYRAKLAQRLDPTAAILQSIHDAVRASDRKTIVFAEGEEPMVIRAAFAFQNQGLGGCGAGGPGGADQGKHAPCVGVPEDAIRIVNARLSDRNADYADWLFTRLQRRGYLRRGCTAPRQ